MTETATDTSTANHPPQVPEDDSPAGLTRPKPMPLVPPDHPALRAVAEPVAEDELGHAPLAQLAADMLATMYQGGGIGLAANQVGVLKRIIVLDLRPHGEPEAWVMVNPVVLERRGHRVWEEGCLTLPMVRRRVRRPMHVLVSYFDLDGLPCKRRVRDLEAAVIEHEVDHLNGVLFTDKARR